MGEAFPLNVKGEQLDVNTLCTYKSLFPICTGVGASNVYSLYWMFAFISNFITPKLLGPPLHIHGYLYLMAVTNLLGLLFVVIAIPETKVGNDLLYVC